MIKTKYYYDFIRYFELAKAQQEKIQEQLPTTFLKP